jgi:hypothetical protein
MKQAVETGSSVGMERGRLANNILRSSASRGVGTESRMQRHLRRKWTFNLKKFKYIFLLI